MKIKQLYKVKREDKVKQYAFLPLITVHDETLTEVIKISLSEKNINMVNGLILYLFKDKEDADRFILIIRDYISKDYKHCKDGQLFWPEFRILTKKALNYNIIQNITPTRKYVLDSANADHDFRWLKHNKEKGK